jgi:hypothetical protein
MQVRVIMAPLFLLVFTVFLVASRAPEAASPHPAQRAEAHHVGSVVDWRLESDGTFYVLVDGRRQPARSSSGTSAPPAQDEGEAARLWFKTPPIQGQQVHFQDLVLLVVLHTHQAGSTLSRISFWGDPTPTSRGETRESAITMNRIGPG